MELVWGVEGILICVGIYAMIKFRRMHHIMQSMQGQIDELVATHVLMQDHLNRIGQELRPGSLEPPTTRDPGRGPHS